MRRQAAGLALLVTIAASCHDRVEVEVPHGGAVFAGVAIDDPAIAFGIPTSVAEGATAEITSLEMVADPVTTCAAETAFWTASRPIGAVWIDAAEWGFEPFNSLVIDEHPMLARLVVSVQPGADCEPGDVIEFSGYRLGYDDRGFPSTTESSMRFEVEIVDESNR